MAEPSATQDFRMGVRHKVYENGQFTYIFVHSYSVRKDFTGLAIAALIVCEQIVMSPSNPVIAIASKINNHVSDIL